MAATGSRKDYDVRIRAHDETRAAFQQAQSRISSFTRSAETLNDSLGAQTSAMRANATAAQAMGAAHRASSAQMRMLFPQLMQIGQSIPLAFQSPLTFMQNFAYQSTDIAQIYSGRGGVTAAFRDSATMVGRFAAKLGPVGIAAGIAALGMAGLQDEIRETTGASVSFGNIAVATMQEVSAAVMTIAAPAIAALAPVFDRVAGAIFDTLKLLGNSIVNTFDFAVKTVVSLWQGLPGALADIGVRAAQGLLDQITYMAREAVSIWNGLMADLGLQDMQVGAPVEIVPRIELGNANPGAAAGLLGELASNYENVFDNDRVGEFFGRVGQRAVSLATASDAVADSLDRVGTAAQSAGAPMDLLGQSVQAANDNFEAGRGIFNNFFQDLSKQIQQGASVWDAFKRAGLNALNSVLSKVMEMASNSLFMSLFGGGSGGGGGLLSGLLGSFGGFFANGGTLGAGQWGIAGETAGMQHAEIIHGPAGITPVRDLMAANSNSPQPVVINQNITVSGTIGAAEIAQAIQQGNQSVMAQIPGVSLTTVTTTNRRAPGSLG